MGKLFDRFSKQSYRNEADVSQNFVIPLLTEFLGYSLEEIIPEEKYPAKDVHSGVFKKGDTKGLTNKPDYVICINRKIEDPKFILDSKNSSEKIDDHLPQLKSYSVSVGSNLIVMTNGFALKIYDVNQLLFESITIADLDIRLEQLILIIGRTNQASKNLKEIIRSIDDRLALGLTPGDLVNQELEKRKVTLSDFSKYIDSIIEEYKNWEIPISFQGLNNLNLIGFDPNHLHTFRFYKLTNDISDSSIYKDYSLTQILNDYGTGPTAIIGETGIGKSSLLRFLTYQHCLECKQLKHTNIPVYISLKNINEKTSLFNLIERELEIHGFSVSSLIAVLNNHNFFIYLDAYDEIPDKQVTSFISELNDLLKTNCKCVLTTRNRRIPSIKPINLFSIEPLSDDKIIEFSQYYLEDRHYNFISEVKAKSLHNEARNTLLLLFMISIYKEENTLPLTINNITCKILRRFKDWEIQKETKQDSAVLNWSTIEVLLSEIAYYSVEVNVSVITNEDLNKLIMTIIDELINTREVSIALTIGQVSESLFSTGIILKNESGVYFWHRVFQNYYASLGFANKFKKEKVDIKSIITVPRWATVMIGSSIQLENSSKLILAMEGNLWLQGNVLLEARNVDEQVAIDIIRKLTQLCQSTIVTIRDRALDILTRIDKKFTRELFWDLFKYNPNLDVKMTAFEEIAKEKTNIAKDLVIQNIEWEESSTVWGRFATLSVIRALANFGEEEILKIVDIWDRQKDMFTESVCQDIFIQLYEKGCLTKKVIAKLYNFYLEKIDGDIFGNTKLRVLNSVLKYIKCEDYIVNLIDKLGKQILNEGASVYDIVELLSSYDSKSSFEALLKHCKSEDENIAYGCTKVLENLKYKYDYEEIKELFNSKHKLVKMYSIQTLVRFPFDKVKDDLLKFLNSEDRREHEMAMDVCCSNGSILEIIRDNNLPEKLTGFSISSLLSAIRKYKISEAVSIIDNINEHYFEKTNDVRIRLEGAKTYASIGFEDKGIQIIERFKDKEGIWQLHGAYDRVYLVEILPEFSSVYAMPTLFSIFKQYESEILKHSNSYFEGKYLDAVEVIGGSELKETVKAMVSSSLEALEKKEIDHLMIERPLRTLTRIGSLEDEDSILHVLNKQINLSYINLNRAIHCLQIFGTEKSITTIKKIAKDTGHDEIRNACLTAYEQILQRKGIYREVKQDELLQ